MTTKLVTTSKRNNTPIPGAPNARLSDKERFLILVYRILKDDAARERVDRALSLEWIAQPKPTTPAAIDDHNDSFGAHIARLRLGGIGADWLVYFANVGRRTIGGVR